MNRRLLLLIMCAAAVATPLSAQETGVDRVRPRNEVEEQKKEASKTQSKIAQSANFEIVGATAFPEKELREQLKEQITSIEQLGLTAARADDASFFLQLYYRKHGYEKAEVNYNLLGGNRLRLVVKEGARLTLANVNFVGNEHITSEKLFDFVIGPTRERYAKTEKALPFVPTDLDSGVDLVRRLYIAEGFLNVIVQAPHYSFNNGGTEVSATVAIVEGRHFSFGDVSFAGHIVFEPKRLRKEIADLLQQPYTERRLADIPRRLQAYFKKRGYHDVKVDAAGHPEAVRGSAVPVQVTIASGPVYHFDGAQVTGLRDLKSSYVTNRFRGLSGQRYDPDVIDTKFRTLMRTGLFTVLQIKPVPINADTLRLEITAEEAKSQEFGFSIGYGTYDRYILGAQYSERSLFSTGRPLTTSAEITGRGYKGEIIYEDPFLFETENHLKFRLSAVTYDFDGYSRFEIGSRIDLTRKFGKAYEVGAVLIARHVDITKAEIAPQFLGRTSYLVNSIGYTQTYDPRKSPLVSPRGFTFDNTFDVATSAIGSQIEFVRSTAHVGYYLPFAPETRVVDVTGAADKSGLRRFFERSMLLFGARAGIVHGFGDNANGIPIDERFFTGGSTTVRSFAERDLGPHDRRNPIGGEFYSVFNAEYEFPIFGDLYGAAFFDAGNLLPNSDDIGLQDMRYAIGMGLRYKLPIGPVRLDYGVNPSPRAEEDFGAFHFSFGFAF